MSYQVDAAPDGEPQRGPVQRASLGKRTRLEKPAADFEIVLPVGATSGRDRLRVSITYYYCREGAEGVCKVGSVLWKVPLELSPDAPTSVIPLRHRVP
jgi:hypothetical protein